MTDEPLLLDLLPQLKTLISSGAAEQAQAIINTHAGLNVSLLNMLRSLDLINDDITQRIIATAAPPIAAPTQQITPAPVPAPPVAVAPAALLATLPPEQRDLVRMIMALSPEQLALMPAEDRAKFAELRRQFTGL